MKKSGDQHDESMFAGAPPESFLKARELRERMTLAEQKLWKELKGNKFHGLKFRRQHPIMLYIADFYCHKLKLVIEIDGQYHNDPEQRERERDKERTKALEEMALKVIRFTNKEVIEQLQGVLKSIEKAME